MDGISNQSLLKNLNSTNYAETAYETDNTVEESLELGDYYTGEGYGQWVDRQLQSVNLDILLPNGLLIPIQCPPSRTLFHLKQDVFIRAKRMPLSSQLDVDQTNYIFSGIGFNGVHVELYDEEKPISSMSTLLPLLTLIEPDGNKEEKELTQLIGAAMGIQLKDMERFLNDEYSSFRIKLYETCCQINLLRDKEGPSHYFFPEESLFLVQNFKEDRHEFDEICEADLDYINLSENPREMEERIVENLKRKIQFSESYMEVWYPYVKKKQTDEANFVKVFGVIGKTSGEVIIDALYELRSKNGIQIDYEPFDFILQIAGRCVYISNESIALTQFEYIRSCFENYRNPKLVLRLKSEVFNQYKTLPKLFEPTYIRKEKHNKYIDTEIVSDCNDKKRNFWDLDENLSLNILSASHITVLENMEKLFLRVAVVIGRHVLDVRESSSVSLHNPRWLNGHLEFSIYLKDLPPSTHLSIALIATTKRTSSSLQKGDKASSTQQFLPVGWTHFRLFNWKRYLKQRKRMLFLWPYTKELLSTVSEQVESLQFLNLDVQITTDFNIGGHIANLPCIEIELPEYNSVIEWPSASIVQKFISILNHRGSSNDERNLPALIPGNKELERILLLRRYLDASQLNESDQMFLWKMRLKIQRLFSQMLPVLADCWIIWREREKICELYYLIDNWPSLHVETAIELLDSRYVDEKLRKFAVDQLDASLNNDQLQLYLLVLVQAIRYELHADSHLAKMLLTRSLLDYRLGSVFFWLLRSELAQLGPIVLDPLTDASTSTRLIPIYLRYALLLEAYCRGNSIHLPSMNKQVEMIGILTAISIKVRTISNKDSANKALKEHLMAHNEALQNLISPLNSLDFLGELMIDQCRVLGSAKQPLLLTWKNPECFASVSTPTHQLIFKNGDDMRQDMLTLQVMRIMDSKWKRQNHDYCLTLYEVLPMGKNIGLIHVVQYCKTIFQIQNSDISGSSFSMDVALLNKHIYKKCSNDSKQYLECVDRFTCSLAGYCIATYILGIKDRHQDNIMLTKDGKIFHIDFGHFLGHTKRKLGINRERTDFVLTDHFLFVVSKGKPNFRQTYEYFSFRDECTKGFMIIHYHARFFIVLFRMMLCMGLPELSSLVDVDFLRSSLMYDKVERDEAKASFEQIFEHVVKGDWFVKVDWFFHSMNHARILPSIHHTSKEN